MNNTINTFKTTPTFCSRCHAKNAGRFIEVKISTLKSGHETIVEKTQHDVKRNITKTLLKYYNKGKMLHKETILETPIERKSVCENFDSNGKRTALVRLHDVKRPQKENPELNFVQRILSRMSPNKKS